MTEIDNMDTGNVPSNFCGLCAQKVWRGGTFSGNSPRIRALSCPKLREDQKKFFLHPEMEQFLCPKLRQDPKRRFSPSSGAVFVSEIT